MFNVGSLKFRFGFFQKLAVLFQQIHALEVFAQKIFSNPTDAGTAVQNPAVGRAVLHTEQFVEKKPRVVDVRGGHVGESPEHTVNRGGNVRPIILALLVIQIVHADGVLLLHYNLFVRNIYTAASTDGRILNDAERRRWRGYGNRYFLNINLPNGTLLSNHHCRMDE